MDNKMKDSDIKKALECCAVTHDCRKNVEIERLKGIIECYEETSGNKKARAEAIKEFAEKVNREITEAIISNDDAIREREKKHCVNRYEDNFCAMCEGKIIALGGIKSFINDLVKERLGE